MIHVWWITERKKGPTLDWAWANSESTVFATNVSETCQGTWPNPTSLSSVLTVLCPSFFPFLFFSILCLRFRYHQDFFRHSKFLLLYTFANSGDPARFLFPISLFPPLRMLLRISRDSPIFVFVFELDVRLLLFIFCSFLIFLRPFFLFRSFSDLVLSFFLPCLSSSRFFFVSFRLLTSSVASFDSTRVYSFFSISSSYFFSLICLFRIFRIRFSVRAFYVSCSFSRIIPVLFNLFLYFVLSPSFSPQPLPSSPSLIPLFLSFSLLRLDLLWSLIKKNNRKDVIGAAGEAKH